MNRPPLQSFDSILAAIDRLRGSEPIYFRNFRKANDKKRSDDVEKWLDIAIKVDTIARDLVKASINIAIFNAKQKEKEWLRKGLNLSTLNDMNAKVIIKLVERFKENQKESPERLAIKRFQEFGEICLKVAEGLQPLIGDSQNRKVKDRSAKIKKRTLKKRRT